MGRAKTKTKANKKNESAATKIKNTPITKKQQQPYSSTTPLPSPPLPPHLLQNIVNDDNNPIETLCPGAVFYSRNLLTPSECQSWITHATSTGFERQYHPATRFVAHRDCGRLQRTDPHMARRLYERLSSIVAVVTRRISDIGPPFRDGYRPIGCNPNIRIYRYDKGMSFGRHVDGSNRVVYDDDDDDDGRGGVVAVGDTEVTVLVYLSSCDGGATRFYPVSGRRSDRRDGVAFVPEAGAVLLHAHGDRCLEHEADPVMGGVKYVLRTDIVFGMTRS